MCFKSSELTDTVNIASTLVPQLCLAKGISPEDRRFFGKAELCPQTGSQAGAWEPEEKSRQCPPFYGAKSAPYLPFLIGQDENVPQK
jgi:hypothetical protein